MRVEIISRERIKPSCSTPQSLRTYKFSLLDQLIVVPYTPIILFYLNHCNESHPGVLNRPLLLKESLSETLTRFYPLAGVIKDDDSIDCNDEGANFLVAQVNCRLSDEFPNHTDIHLINQFFPCQPSLDGLDDVTTVTNIQLNLFECGGIAIGICISHKAVDGASLITFIKDWATTTFKIHLDSDNCLPNPSSQLAVPPDFTTASSLFPAIKDQYLRLRDSTISMWYSMVKTSKRETRRFVFNASAISKLKSEVIKYGVQNPTRVEVITAFIWKIAISACKEKYVGGSRSHSSSLMVHSVNLRKSGTPPQTLSENSMGNLLWMSSAKYIVENNYDDMVFHEMVTLVRKGISKVKGELMKQLEGGDVNFTSTLISENMKMIENMGSEKGADSFFFTSFCNYGLYDIDFGWGKPIWTWTSFTPARDSPEFINLIVLMDTKCRKGIEACVTLDEQVMDAFKQDQHLLAMSSLD